MSLVKQSSEYKTRDPRFKSREAAEEVLNINHDRLGDIETGVISPREEEVVLMTEAYNCPELYNFYCTRHCKIGCKHVAPIENIDKLRAYELPQLTLKFTNSLKAAAKLEDKLDIIAEDGLVDDTEAEDFVQILNTLKELESRTKALRVWALKEANLRHITTPEH